MKKPGSYESYLEHAALVALTRGGTAELLLRPRGLMDREQSQQNSSSLSGFRL